MTSELKPLTFADELRAAVRGGLKTHYEELLLQAAELIGAKKSSAAPSADPLSGLQTYGEGEYVLHSEAAKIVAMQAAEIERLKDLIDGDSCADPDKIDALFRRAEAAEAELAQIKEQEPVAWRYQNCFGGEPLCDCWQYASWRVSAEGDATSFACDPLYAAPVSDSLKAENERLREAAQAIIDRWDTPHWKDAEPTAEAINSLRAALNVEASNDKG